MQQIFTEKNKLIQDEDGLISLELTGDDYNHVVNVLRMHRGDELAVHVDGESDREYRFGIEEIGDGRAYCLLRFIKENNVELPAKIYLFQGIPKADKLEFIIQKAVELGVYAVIPVTMKRSVVKVDESKQGRRTERLGKIARAAAEQSRRGIVPEVYAPMSLREALEFAEREGIDCKIMPYELAEPDFASTRRIFGTLADTLHFPETSQEHRNDVNNGYPQTSGIGILIGPEGGIDPAEVRLATEHGFMPITLGRRILRTETAPIAVLSWLNYILET